MKKRIFLLLVTLSSCLFSQNTYTDLPGKWRIGLNAGAMWQASDVTPHANIAGGFNIERILNKRADAIVGFALGVRYLSGHCTGQDTKPSYGVANNTALNGTLYPSINYAQPSVSGPGYFYNNYKTFIQEGNLELKMNFPRLEQKTRIIFHVFGGLGICRYKTWINALDANGNMYDFSSLQNQNNVSEADLRTIMNGSYGTLAQGSAPNGTYRFTPSAGLGLGFKLSRHVALVFEYKVSFPRTNYLDGVSYDIDNKLIKQNDFYNYLSANLLFTIYGRTKKTTNTNAYSSAQQVNSVPTNTVINNTYNTYNTYPANNPPPVINANPGYYNNQYPNQVGYAPYVSISSPSNNYSSQNEYISVQAAATNISSAQQINISQNGYPVKYFSYDPYNGSIKFQVFLHNGANNIIITANNQYGAGSQGVTVFYNPPYAPQTGGMVTVEPSLNNNTLPVVTETTTASNPTQPHIGTVDTPTLNSNQPHIGSVGTPTLNTNQPVINTGIVGTPTLNAGQPQINGGNIGTPTLNVTSPIHEGSVATPTLNGTQPYIGSVGTPTLNATAPHIGQTVIPAQLGTPPSVQFINPSASVTETEGSSFDVQAGISNITSYNQVKVKVDGNDFTSFNFNPSTKILSFSASLQTGYNSITIIANNQWGGDTKSTVIDYKPKGSPPRVTIFNPASSPFTSNQPNQTVNGYVYNVISSSDIHVLLNGQTVSFTYNMGTHEIDIPLTLSSATNTVSIQATNLYGNNSASLLINYQPPNTGSSAGGAHGLHNKPEITVISPSSNPYTSLNGVISISANVNFILNEQGVNVTYNGAPVAYSYNKDNEHLSFTSPLKSGSNTFVISASNSYGNTTKSIEINYIPTSTGQVINGYQQPKGFTISPLHGAGNASPSQPINTPVQIQSNQNQGRPMIHQEQNSQPVNSGKPLIRPR